MRKQNPLKLFSFIKPKSLKSKFLVSVLPIVTLCFLGVSVIAGIFFYHTEKQKILNRYENDSNIYIKPLTFSLWNMNNSVLQSQINSILNHPDISGVKLTESVYGLVFTAGDTPEVKQLNEYLFFSRDIVYATYSTTEKLGTLNFYFKKTQLFKMLIKEFFQYSFLFIILIVIVIASAMFSYNRTITTPLKKLLRSIRQFDQDQHARPVEWTADDEIGQVITAYNGLIISLELGNSQLKRALDDAKKANASKSEFLANMSHEIRTPLNGIQGLAEVVLDSSLNPEQKNFLNTIYMESEQLLTIVNDILDFSKIEAGKMDIDHIPFDLRHTIENLCASLSVQAEKKGLELVHYIESTTPTNLTGDPGRVRQILINLIGNAIKFTHTGEIFITVQKVTETDEKVLFRFNVKDTGIGIAKDKQSKIFESFSQADGSTTRKFGGTGLGITISKMLIEQMGGFIGLKSEPGIGTQFYFELKFSKQKEISQTRSIKHEELTNLTMLVIDDLKTNLDIFSDYFKSWGSLALTAQTIEDGLHLLDKCQETDKEIAAIFIDHGILEQDGFELVKKIRKMNYFSNTPLAVLSSMGVIGDGKQYRELGVNGYLVKPVCQEDLKTFIMFVLGQGTATQNPDTLLVTRHTIAESRRKNIKILLAEDYETNQKLAIKQLETAGFNVTLACDGLEAVDICSRQDFDVILMDIQMPKMDGYEACNRIRNMEGDKKRTPIIAMTAHALKGYKEQCLKAGMDDYITKPFKKEILLSTISKWIQSQAQIHPPETILDVTSLGRKSQSESPVFNLENALYEFGNDEPFFYEVFDQFLTHVETQIKTIRTALDKKDYKTVKNEAHSIKGGAANLTAAALSDAAFNLEIFGKVPGKQSGQKLLDAMVVEFERLKEFRKKLTKPPQ